MHLACPSNMSTLAFQHLSPSHLSGPWTASWVTKVSCTRSLALTLMHFAKHWSLWNECSWERGIEPTKFTSTISQLWSSESRLPLQLQHLEYWTAFLSLYSVSRRVFFHNQVAVHFCRLLCFRNQQLLVLQKWGWLTVRLPWWMLVAHSQTQTPGSASLAVLFADLHGFAQNCATRTYNTRHADPQGHWRQLTEV